MLPRCRSLRTSILLLVIAVQALVAFTSARVVVAAHGKVLTPSQVPDDAPSTAIVLGAKVDDGQVGVYVRARLDVAIELYRDGKVSQIVNSGNDSDDAGNEVQVMRAYLLAHGVPARVIVDDPLGINTAATCRRAAQVFGINRALIITQNFHVGRAVMLCESYGIDARGVIAPCDECSTLSLVRNQLREALGSRPRAVWDAYRAGR